MDLDKYLTDNKITNKTFGSELEPPVSNVAVSLWRNRKRIPRHKYMKQIKINTSHAVTEIDFYN